MMPRYFILRVLLLLAVVFLFYNFVLYERFFMGKNESHIKDVPQSDSDLKSFESNNENLQNEQQIQYEQQKQELLPEEKPQKEIRRSKNLKKAKESAVKSAQDDFDRASQDIEVKPLKSPHYLDKLLNPRNAPDGNSDNVAQNNLPKANDRNKVRNYANDTIFPRNGNDDQQDNQFQNQNQQNVQEIDKKPQVNDISVI